MNIIGCFDIPTSGTYYLKGKDVSRMKSDEPTGALDSCTGIEILEMPKGFNEEGNTIVLITHDNGIAEEALRKVGISDGQIVSDEPTARARGAAG